MDWEWGEGCCRFRMIFRCVVGNHEGRTSEQAEMRWRTIIKLICRGREGYLSSVDNVLHPGVMRKLHKLWRMVRNADSNSSGRWVLDEMPLKFATNERQGGKRESEACGM